MKLINKDIEKMKNVLDRKEIILVENNWIKNSSKHRCSKCILYSSISSTPKECHKIQKRLNLNCEFGKYIIKDRENLVNCTRENTNVGDTVYLKEDIREESIVEYLPCIGGHNIEKGYWDFAIRDKDVEYSKSHTESFDFYVIEEKQQTY